MALSNNGYIGIDGAYKPIAFRYVGVNGNWRQQKFTFFGDSGYWRLGYTLNQIDLGLPFYIRYINGYNVQKWNSIELNGLGFKDYQIISPKTGAYYELLSNAADYFDNFASGSYQGTPTIGGALGDEQCMLINTGTTTTTQSFRLPPSQLDALGVFGAAGDKDFNLSGHVYIPALPVGGDEIPLFTYGTRANGFEVVINNDGALVQKIWNANAVTTMVSAPFFVAGWNSYCLVKIGGTTNVYKKGSTVSQGSGSLNLPPPAASVPIYIGAGITPSNTYYSVAGTGYKYFYQSTIVLSSAQISKLTDRANPLLILKKNNIEYPQDKKWLIGLSNTKINFTISDTPELGEYELFIRYNDNAESYHFPFLISQFNIQYEAFSDDFSSPATIDKNYNILRSQWGGANGGVVPENVFIRDGELILRANGDLYGGNIQGVDRSGNPKIHTDPNDPLLGQPWKHRVGGVIQYNKTTGFGRYEVDCLIPNELGVAYAIWTFKYQEIYPNDPRYPEFKSEFLHEQGNLADGFYTVRNHEIDIEFPSHLSGGTLSDPSLGNFKANNWTGELQNWDVPYGSPGYWEEYDTQLVSVTGAGLTTIADGNYHKLRFDWYPDKVEYYIDDVLIRTNFQTTFPDSATIPNIAGQFVFGVWFPSSPLPAPKAYLVNPDKAWAGGIIDPVDGGMKADFDSVEMKVRGFKYTPFPQLGIRYFGDTYPFGLSVRKGDGAIQP